MKELSLKGIVPPIITPILPNEDIDEEGTRAIVEHCIKSGLHAIFVAGSNGEAMSISQSERNRLIQIAIDQTRKRVPVLCGVMDASTRKVIDNIKAMEQLGGTVAVVTPAFYIRNSCQHEIITHYEQIAKATSANLIIYNIPPFTSVNVLHETVVKLSEIDKVIGYKDSGNNFVQFQRSLQYFRDKDFVVFQGITEMAAASLLMGADGIIPVLAPQFPELFLRLYESASSGDVSGARRYQRLVCETSRILSMGMNAVSAAKFSLSLLGLSSKQVTRPVEPLSETEEMNIRNYVSQLNDKLGELLANDPESAG